MVKNRESFGEQEREEEYETRSFFWENNRKRWRYLR
jgi:hypothetical protein